MRKTFSPVRPNRRNPPLCPRRPISAGIRRSAGVENPTWDLVPERHREREPRHDEPEEPSGPQNSSRVRSLIPICRPAAPIGRDQLRTAHDRLNPSLGVHPAPSPALLPAREISEGTRRAPTSPNRRSNHLEAASRERVAVEAGRQPPAGNGQLPRPVAESPRSRNLNANWAASSRVSSPSSRMLHRSTSHHDAGAGERRFDREEAIGTVHSGVRGRLPPPPVPEVERSDSRRRPPAGGCGIAAHRGSRAPAAPRIPTANDRDRGAGAGAGAAPAARPRRRAGLHPPPRAFAPREVARRRSLSNRHGMARGGDRPPPGGRSGSFGRRSDPRG